MNIQEACKLAIASGKKITREDEFWEYGNLKIEPTDTDECCIAYSGPIDKCARWEPKAEDLVANDWKITE